MKNNKILSIAICLFLTYSTNIQAQKFTGFWEVEKVMVGTNEMTPIAKWTEIRKDHTFASGNGWLQNSAGTWTFDKKTKTFEPKETKGQQIDEGASGFEVTMVGKDKMQWRRTEEGMPVVVNWKRISKRPLAPKDMLLGLWGLEQATKEGKDVLNELDPNNKRNILIRWDNLYKEQTASGGKATGYWFVHSHKNEITLLSHDQNKDAETWGIEGANEVLKLTGISDTNRDLILTFKRLKSFGE